jgi:uncharacterized protein (DUF1499 family)
MKVKGVLMTLVTLALLAGCSSTKPSSVGLVDGNLNACPGTPNCVTTEGTNPSATPLPFTDSPKEAWVRAKVSVTEAGGKIMGEEEGYLWAIFTSTAFRFVDDLELRMDEEAKVIHLRTASRVGYSDFGANKKRYRKIAELFAK